jgi:pilus assembly protein CpaC
MSKVTRKRRWVTDGPRAPGLRRGVPALAIFCALVAGGLSARPAQAQSGTLPAPFSPVATPGQLPGTVSPPGAVFTPVAQPKPAAVQAAQPPAQPPGPEKLPGIKDLEVGPMPKPFDPLDGKRPRLPFMGGPGPIGTTPQPTPKDLEEYNKFVEKFIDPRNTLDLVEGRSRVMILKQAPKRVQVADPSVVEWNNIKDDPKQILVLGRKVGSTVMNLWFTDPADPAKEVILSYLVRVIPDPEQKERLERVYKALENEINRMFPDSVVHLSLAGDKLVISGQAHDIMEATQILRIVRANAPDSKQAAKIPVDSINLNLNPANIAALGGTPGLESFLTAGGPNVINLLRIPGEQQVMLRVTVAEVSRNAARSIGLNFSITNKAGQTVFQNLTGGLLTGGGGGLGSSANLTGVGGSSGAPTSPTAGNLPILLDNGQVSLALNALRNLSYARSLAEPNLVALNGQTAYFQSGGEFPVPVISGFTAAGLQGVQYVPYGVSLYFTPYITDKDRIRLNVSATVSTRDASIGTSVGGSAQTNSSFVPGININTFQTTVELREGQSLAVAGLIQTNLGADASRVPGIGDIPVLNWLTGFQRISYGEQELVVLVTPHLVHPLEQNEIPRLPGSDIFEPGDFEFYLCGRLEGRRDYDYRSTVMTDFCRMWRYHQCEQIYMFGPSGYTAVPSYTTNPLPHP